MGGVAGEANTFPANPRSSRLSCTTPEEKAKWRQGCQALLDQRSKASSACKSEAERGIPPSGSLYEEGQANLYAAEKTDRDGCEMHITFRFCPVSNATKQAMRIAGPSAPKRLKAHVSTPQTPATSSATRDHGVPLGAAAAGSPPARECSRKPRATHPAARTPGLGERAACRKENSWDFPTRRVDMAHGHLDLHLGSCILL